MRASVCQQHPNALDFLATSVLLPEREQVASGAHIVRPAADTLKRMSFTSRLAVAADDACLHGCNTTTCAPGCATLVSTMQWLKGAGERVVRGEAGMWTHPSVRAYTRYRQSQQH